MGPGSMKKLMFGALALGSAVLAALAAERIEVPEYLSAMEEEKEEQEKVICPKCNRVSIEMMEAQSIAYSCNHCGAAGIGFQTKEEAMEHIVHL